MIEMNCEEFQRVLPQIIESGGNADEEVHLSSCLSCSELVQDLRYIAEQAKLLLPLRDPNPRVWNNIQESLVREGLIRDNQRSADGPSAPGAAKKKSWTSFGIVLAVLAVLALAKVLVRYHPVPAPSQETIAPAAQADSAHN
jgi:hypothetical protein